MADGSRIDRDAVVAAQVGSASAFYFFTKMFPISIREPLSEHGCQVRWPGTLKPSPLDALGFNASHPLAAALKSGAAVCGRRQCDSW